MTIPVTTKYTTAGAHSWTWADADLISVEIQVWSGGAGGEDDIPPERGGAGGSGGGSTRRVLCRGVEESIDLFVGDGGFAGEPGEDSYVTQNAVEVFRVTGAAACAADDEELDGGGHAGVPGDGDYNGGVGDDIVKIHTMFFDLPAPLNGGRGGSGAGFNSDGITGLGKLGGGDGGTAGQPPAAEGGATDGGDGTQPGGGGGGGGQGKVSGRGAAGEIWVTYPPHKRGGRCCCNEGCPACVTRESLGLPETFSAAFAPDEITGDGMPADGEVGDGSGCSESIRSFLRWSQGTPLAGILNGNFEFVEQSDGGGCCFLYRSVGGYTPSECGDATNQNVVGNPYDAQATGTDIVVFQLTGNAGGNPRDWPYKECDGETPVPEPSCKAACGTPCFTVTDGEIFTPLPVYGEVTLGICINGTVVTISAGSGPVIPCRTYGAASSYCEGSSGFNFPTGDPCHDELHCEYQEPPTYAGEAGCSGRTGIVHFSATADLADTSGDTIWDKIKNYPWHGNYDEQSCSCADGGCAANSKAVQTCYCYVLPPTCFCGSGSIAHPGEGCGPDDTVVTTGDTAVDVPCIYGTGTMTASFS